MSEPNDKPNEAEEWGGLTWAKEKEEDPDIQTFKSIWKTGKPQKFGWKALEVLQIIKKLGKMNVDFRGNSTASYLQDHGWDADPASPDSLASAGYLIIPSDDVTSQDVSEEARLRKAQERLDYINSMISFIPDEKLREDLQKEVDKLADATKRNITAKPRKTTASKLDAAYRETIDKIDEEFEKYKEKSTTRESELTNQISRLNRDLEDAKRPPPNYIWVKVIEDLQPFVGRDFKTRGPYKEGEAINLPEDDAKSLEAVGKVLKIVGTAGVDPKDEYIARLQGRLNQTKEALDIATTKPPTLVEKVVERVVEKVVYKEKPPEQKPTKPTEQGQSPSDPILWTTTFEKRLLDTYMDILIRAKVATAGKKYSLNATITRLKEERGLRVGDVTAEVERLANEIAGTYSKQLRNLKIEPMPPPSGRREIDEVPEDRIVGPEYSPIKARRDRKSLGYPGIPSGLEIDSFWAIYQAALYGAGIIPRQSDFDKYFAKHTYKSFPAVETALNELIDSIVTDKEPDHPRPELLEEGVGMLYGDGEHGYKWLPDSTVYGQIIHALFVTYSNMKPHTVDDIAKITGHPKSDVTKAIRDAYYANKEASEKGLAPGEALPYYELKKMTKQDFENTLQESLPDKRHNGAVTP